MINRCRRTRFICKGKVYDFRYDNDFCKMRIILPECKQVSMLLLLMQLHMVSMLTMLLREVTKAMQTGYEIWIFLNEIWERKGGPKSNDI